MTTRPINQTLDRSNFPRLNIVGIIFFMIGGPSVDAFRQQSIETPKLPNFERYATIVMLTGAFAVVLRLLILWRHL